jgi:hypothetical protein
MEWDKNFGSGGNLGWNYYYSMAFSGQFQVDIDDKIVFETESFKALVPDSNKREEIVQIILNELKSNSDAKGTKCN